MSASLLRGRHVDTRKERRALEFLRAAVSAASKYFSRPRERGGTFNRTRQKPRGKSRGESATSLATFLRVRLERCRTTCLEMALGERKEFTSKVDTRTSQMHRYRVLRDRSHYFLINDNDNDIRLRT